MNEVCYIFFSLSLSLCDSQQNLDALLLTYITFLSSLSRLCDFNSRSLLLITCFWWISSNLQNSQSGMNVNNPNHSNCTKTSMYHCIYMRLFRTVFLFFSFVEINSRGGKMTANVINEKQWLSIYFNQVHAMIGGERRSSADFWMKKSFVYMREIITSIILDAYAICNA